MPLSKGVFAIQHRPGGLLLGAPMCRGTSKAEAGWRRSLRPHSVPS